MTTDPTTSPPPGVIGRALLAGGNLFTEAGLDQWLSKVSYSHPRERAYVEQTEGPAQEVLLVSPALVAQLRQARRVVAAAQQWRDVPPVGDEELMAEKEALTADLIAAVDARDQPDAEPLPEWERELLDRQDDGADRRRWVAALRWVAEREPEVVIGSTLAGWADAIEDGALTPWADQPEASRDIPNDEPAPEPDSGGCPGPNDCPCSCHKDSAEPVTCVCGSAEGTEPPEQVQPGPDSGPGWDRAEVIELPEPADFASEVRGRAHVIGARMADGYEPPSASMRPPAPEPDSGPGWTAAEEVDGLIRALESGQVATPWTRGAELVRNLLADRDGQRAAWSYWQQRAFAAEDKRDSARDELAEARAEVDQLRSTIAAAGRSSMESAERAQQAQAEVHRLRGELATARRDGAADALVAFGRRIAGQWPIAAALAEQWVREVRAGTITIPATQPAEGAS